MTFGSRSRSRNTSSLSDLVRRRRNRTFDPGDDPAVFDRDNLQAVADGRFFRIVEGDATRYRLHEDGLTLALGFAVVDRLHHAHRNGRGLEEPLEELIEPVVRARCSCLNFSSPVAS